MMIGSERVLIDIDFRSEFEIARPTKTYKAILQTVPYIFVGKTDRLQNIIAIVSEAAKQSLKKKGMHIPPWRKAEYVKAKWLSPYTRVTPPTSNLVYHEIKEQPKNPQALTPTIEELNCGERKSANNDDHDNEELNESVFTFSDTSDEWKPPAPKPKSIQSGVKVVTGLTAVFDDNP